MRCNYRKTVIGTMNKDVIYRLDMAATDTLTEQLTENLRHAIANGICKPGDKLPGIRQMAKLCGTSVQVPIDALKTLTDEGFVKARPRVGCIVLGRRRKVWHGRILMLHVGAHSNYGQNVFCAEMASLLGAANWRVGHFYVPHRKTGYCDLKALARELAEKHDLVLLPAYDPPVVRIVQKSGIPYMLLAAQVGEHKGAGCIGFMTFNDHQAIAEFVEHCREEHVRRVLNVRHDTCHYMNLGRLRSDGIEVEDMSIVPGMSDLRSESFARLTYEAISRRLGERGAVRPDLICFTDDFFARGGLCALERLGMRAPEDVKVVSLCNYGNAPFYPKPLTRFEFNHFDFAAKTVRAILRYLRTGNPTGNVLCNIRYVRGETF